VTSGIGVALPAAMSPRPPARMYLEQKTHNFGWGRQRGCIRIVPGVRGVCARVGFGLPTEQSHQYDTVAQTNEMLVE